MYKLTPAKPIHAKQIIPYITTTCYWKELAEGNKLGQTYEEFMLEWIVMPRIPFTTVITKEGNDELIYGCVITATIEQLGTLPDCTPHVHPKALEVLGPFFQFAVTDSVLVDLIVVDESLRNQGYGSKLYQVAEDLAKKEGKDCISAFICASTPEVLIAATKRDYIVTGCIRFQPPANVPILYLEKSPECTAMKGYFQSEKYLNTKNMLLS